jgi:hypothetical protein
LDKITRNNLLTNTQSDYFLTPFFVDMFLAIPPKMSLLTPDARQLNFFPMKNLTLRSMKSLGTNRLSSSYLKEITGLVECKSKNVEKKDKVMLEVYMTETEIKALDNFLYMLTSFLLNMNLLFAESAGSSAKRKTAVRVRNVETEMAELKMNKNDCDKKDSLRKSEFSHVVYMPSSLQLAAHNIIGDIGPIAGAVHQPYILRDTEKGICEDDNSIPKPYEFYEESTSLDEDADKSVQFLTPCALELGENKSPLPELSGENDYYISVSPIVYKALQARAKILFIENELLKNTYYHIQEEKLRLFTKDF